MERQNSQLETPRVNDSGKEKTDVQFPEKGFSLGSIDTRTLDALTESAALAISKDGEGRGGIALTPKEGWGISIQIAGRPAIHSMRSLEFDGNTKSITVTASNPDGQKVFAFRNKDGSEGTFSIYPMRADWEKLESSPVKSADAFLRDYEENPKVLMESPALKKEFDAIVRNWGSISDWSVAKMKSILREYVASYGVKVPEPLLLTSVEHQGHPALAISGTNVRIWNSGTKAERNENRPQNLLKPDESPHAVTLEDGRSVSVARNPTTADSSSENYGYKALILDGQRLELSGSVKMLRDGGTKVSTFESQDGKRFRLVEPHAMAWKAPTLTSM